MRRSIRAWIKGDEIMKRNTTECAVLLCRAGASLTEPDKYSNKLSATQLLKKEGSSEAAQLLLKLQKEKTVAPSRTDPRSSAEESTVETTIKRKGKIVKGKAKRPITEEEGDEPEHKSKRSRKL